jgi:GH3 auxin-responsive promoter
MLDITPLFRVHAARRLRQLAAQDAVAVQEAQLRALLATAAPTAFGRDHGFTAIATVAEFQKRVRLRRYEDFWADYWRRDFPRIADSTWPGSMPYFALTSGTTTGTTKFIPCSRAMVRANVRAAIDIVVHHLANRPRSRMMGGKSFMLGGSTDLQQLARGVHAGDLSGIATATMPPWVRVWSFPPRELALLADWEEKIARLAPLSLTEDIRALSGTPSWLLIFFDRLAALRPETAGRLVDFYPNLELLVHGGVNFAPYRHRFESLLAGSHAELREVYAASEGFIALADRTPQDGMRLIVDNGLFFEFVPVEELTAPEPTRHWLATAELGVEYALVLSNCAGAWSYIIGDTVKLVNRTPPRLVVTGRTSYTLSAFGEHLTDAEIELAVGAAAEHIGQTVSDYAIGTLFPEGPGALGRHLYFVEFGGGMPGARAVEIFATAVDQALTADNDDYRAHRAGGFGLGAPEIRAVPPGTFASWMKQRGKLGGQHKVPRIVNDVDLFQSLRDFVARI